MPRVLVILFWCWFAVSMFILVRRGTRRASGRHAHGRDTSATRRPVSWPPLHEIDPLAGDAEAGSDRAPRPDPSPAPRDVAAPTRTMFRREGPPREGVPRPSRGATIATVLDGIRMPCDLAPLMGGIDDLDRRAAFFTVGYPADAVAPEIADELERIGMEFNALSDNTAVARRDDVQVRVAVHAVGPALNGIADPTYPTAPEHSVVVEFELT
jgi:hypothetical protein